MTLEADLAGGATLGRALAAIHALPAGVREQPYGCGEYLGEMFGQFADDLVWKPPPRGSASAVGCIAASLRRRHQASRSKDIGMMHTTSKPLIMLHQLAHADQPPRLLRTPPPQPDEGFHGYLLRLAEENGYDTIAWIHRTARLPIGAVRATPRLRESTLNLASLATLTGCAEEVLRSLSLRLATGSNGEEIYEFEAGTLPLQAVLPTPAKVCPRCLAESAHLRRAWDLVPVTACVRHGTVLQERCGGCGKRLPWRRKTVCRCSCGHDWRQDDVVAASDLELDVSRYFEFVLQPRQPPGYSRFNPLFAVAPQEFLASLCFVAAHWEVAARELGRRLRRGLTNGRTHQLFSDALAVFDHWPTNFQVFVGEQRGKEETRRGTKRVGILYDFPTFDKLSNTPRYQGLKLLREGFQDYLKQHWDGGHLRPNSRIGRGLYEERAYVTLEAAEGMGMTTSELNHFADTGSIRRVFRTMPGGRVARMFHRADILAVSAWAEKLMWPQVAVDELGLSTHSRLVELVSGGLLTPVDFRGGKRRRWKFKPSEVEALRDALEARVAPDGDDPAVLCPSPAALKLLAVAGLNLAAMVRAILAGELPVRGRGKARGVRGLLFRHEELDRWLREQMASRNEAQRLLTGEQVRARLRIHWTNYDWLLREGWLKWHPGPIAGRFALFSEQEIEAFDAQYVPAQRLAADVRSSSVTVTRCLKARHILPVTTSSGPGSLTLFRRADVAPLPLAEIIFQEVKANHERAARAYWAKQKTSRMGRPNPATATRNPTSPPSSPGEVTDEAWATLRDLLAQRMKRAASSGGRHPVDLRSTLNGILFVLRHKVTWSSLPRDLGFGMGATCRRRLRSWLADGVWEQIENELLRVLAEPEQVDWARAREEARVARTHRFRQSGVTPYQRTFGRAVSQ